jgi:hypothetical protein
MNKTVGIIIKIALVAVIALLGYFIIEGIKKPIDFETEKDKRFEMTISRLKDIRTAQIAYKEYNGYYTPSFDTLVQFIKEGDIRVIRAIGFVPDSLTEAEALKLGLVSRDTFFIPIKDSLFKHVKYNLDSLGFIPCGNHAKFKMDTASVLTGSGVMVKVFEARVSYWDVLDGLDKQLIINFNAEKRQRASVDVYVNSTKVLENLSLLNGKGPQSHDFEASKGDTIIVSYAAGAWPHENYFEIVDPAGKYLLKKHTPDPQPGSAWRSKPLTSGGKFSIRLGDEHGDGWCGGLGVGSLIEANNNAGNWE